MRGIGTTSLIVNSGGIFNLMEPLIRLDITESKKNVRKFILETEIQSPTQSLQSESIKKIRKQPEIMDIVKYDNDDDCNFV